MRSFIGFGQTNYIGTPYCNPISLQGIQGIAVPLLFQWISYGASSQKQNINVLVDLTPAPVQSKLVAIRSVFIDNMGSDNPIYVYFPSTGYAVVAQPNSCGWYPVYTRDMKLWVIGEGFLTGDIPQTSVIVTNIPVVPYIDNELLTATQLWLASAQISRGNTIFNTNFGIPALGDQSFQFDFSGADQQPRNLWGTPAPSGFIYLTNLVLVATDLLNNGSPGVGAATIESTGIAGTLMTFQFVVGQAPTIVPNPQVTVYSMGHKNIKLDATQTWQFRFLSGFDAGVLSLYTDVTTNPK